MATSSLVDSRANEMTKPKVILKVEVELDMVPGWGNTGEDFQKHVQNVLNDTIGHYHPVVTIERYNIKELMEELA